MKKIKIGDKLLIHCYKHNGKLHRTWDEATVLEISEDTLICGNFKTRVTESDGKMHFTNEPAIMVFYKNNWFNIIGQLKEFGLFYYCNIATPYILDNNIIKYIDYDLDLRVFPDGSFKVLDKNEYKFHKKIMHYSNDMDLVINRELDNLIAMKKENIGPFAPGFVKKYYEIYQNLTK